MARQPAIGEMTFRAEFQRRGVVDDGVGNEVPGGAWETMFVRSARLTPLKGGEEFIAARLEGRQAYSLVVYDSPTTRQVTEAWQVVDFKARDRVFAISAPGIDPVGNRRFREWLIVEGAPS